MPYRDRKSHYDAFIHNNIPIYDKIFGSAYKVLIVEQSDDGKMFNRGKILNIGFKYLDDPEGIYIS